MTLSNMTLSKKILYGTIGLMILLGIIGFFLPSESIIERSRLIEAPRAKVFKSVNDLEKWPEWIGWWGDSEDVTFSYDELTEGQGARVEWSSDSQSSGELILIESDSQASITYQYTNLDSDISSTGRFELVDEEGDTLVVWTYKMDFGMNPYFRYVGGLLDGMIGTNFEAALRNLKNLIEKESP